MQLLGGLLEVNPGYVRVVEQQGLAAQFFQFLSLEHSNNNVRLGRFGASITVPAHGPTFCQLPPMHTAACVWGCPLCGAET